MIGLVKLSVWATRSGVSRQSAARWLPAGLLPVHARMLDRGTILVDEAKSAAQGVALYARVSSGDQRGELDRQVARLTARARVARFGVEYLEALAAPGRRLVVVEKAEVGGDLAADMVEVRTRFCARRSAKRRAHAARAAAEAGVAA